MSLWLFIGVGLIVLGHWIARRIESKAVMPIVEGIRRMRHAAKANPRRSPAPRDHPRLQAESDYYESTTRDLAARGFVALGDLVEFREDGTEVGVSRWFAAEDGSISGWFAMMPARSTPVMMLVSELVPTRFIVTFLGGPTTRLAIPPTVQRTVVEHSRGIDAAIKLHRQGIEASRTDHARAVHSQEEAVATVESLRSHVNTWRSQQDPEELVELDLRSVLPERSDGLARVVKRVMRRG
jgi:hypothetical protein